MGRKLDLQVVFNNNNGTFAILEGTLCNDSTDDGQCFACTSAATGA